MMVIPRDFSHFLFVFFSLPFSPCSLFLLPDSLLMVATREKLGYRQWFKCFVQLLIVYIV